MPTRTPSRVVQVDGQIRSASKSLVSSISGRQGAVISCRAAYDKRATDSSGRSTTRRIALGTVELSGDLIVDSAVGALFVPQGSFSLDVSQDQLSAMPAGGSLPPELELLAAGRCEAWLVSEQVLQVGDPIELTGTVTPSAHPDCAFEVVPQSGTRLRDRSLDDLSDDLAAMADPARQKKAALIAFALVFAVVVLILISIALA